MKVANYYPAGNLLGRFKDNIQPPNAIFSIPKEALKQPIEDNLKAVPAKSTKLVELSPKVTVPTRQVVPSIKTKPVEVEIDKTQELFINEALKAHNEFRKKHFVAPLKHNRELSRIAQNWAEKVAAKNKLLASGNTYNSQHLGENISMWGSVTANRYEGKI